MSYKVKTSRGKKAAYLIAVLILLLCLFIAYRTSADAFGTSPIARSFSTCVAAAAHVLLLFITCYSADPGNKSVRIQILAVSGLPVNADIHIAPEIF